MRANHRRAPALNDECPGYFQQKISEKEYSGPEPINGLGKVEVRRHGELREGYIRSVQIGSKVE